MDGIQFYKNGVVVQEWDDSLRQYTYRDTEGEVLVQRPYTDEENAQADQRAAESQAKTNGLTLIAKGAQALVKNRDFLALETVTNAQAVAQVRALTRQINALIRLEIRDLADISDT